MKNLVYNFLYVDGDVCPRYFCGSGIAASMQLHKCICNFIRYCQSYLEKDCLCLFPCRLAHRVGCSASEFFAKLIDEKQYLNVV